MEFTISNEVYNYTSAAHNEIVGHQWVKKTMTKLIRKEKHWPYMREHVKRFVKQCPCCQKMSYLRTPIHTHPFTTAFYEPIKKNRKSIIYPN